MGSADRPNILFIYTDQQRADSLGVVSPWMKTPHLDRLAREGVTYTNCFSVSPTCIPARFSLLTGRYPHELGVWENSAVTFPLELPNWVRELRMNGYRTKLIGTSHLRPILAGAHLNENRAFLNAVGFEDVEEIGGPRASRTTESTMTEAWRDAGVLDAFRADLSARYEMKPLAVRPSPLGLEHHYDTYVGRRASECIRNYGHAEPWFLWVGFAGPHEPWDTPAPFNTLYDPESVPLPKPRFDYLPASEPLLRRLRHSAKLGAGELKAAHALRADYAGAVSLIDMQVGSLLGALESRDWLSNTMIVFTSDHGEMNGDFGLIYKETFFNEVVRVPLIVRDPRRRKASVVSTPVESIDVGATLLSLAGRSPLASPAEPLPIENAEDRTRKKTGALSEYAEELMIVVDGWKLAVNRSGHPYLLFDLERDPDELRNLAGAPEWQTKTNELIACLAERGLGTRR